MLSLSYGRIIRKKDINFGLVPKNYKGYQIVYRGNIILWLTDLQNDRVSLRTGLVRERGIITSAYTCLAPFQNADYLQLLLHAYDVQKYFYGLGVGVWQSIGFKDIKYTMIPSRRVVTVKNRPDMPLLSVVRERGVILRELDKSDNHNVIPEDLSGNLLLQKGQFVISETEEVKGDE